MLFLVMALGLPSNTQVPLLSLFYPDLLLLTNVLYVLSVSKNLVSVSALWATSLVTLLFLFIFSGARSSDGGSFGDENDN